MNITFVFSEDWYQEDPFQDKEFERIINNNPIKVYSEDGKYLFTSKNIKYISEDYHKFICK
jgi:hypothetical protein